MIAVFLWVGPLNAQELNLSRNHEAAHEVYAPSVTAAIYLVNFLLLYMANPGLAAYMPAYKAPIPQPIVDCLDQNPTGTGCAYADYSRYLREQTFDNRECFWPTVCQESPRWASLAPRKLTQRGQLNEPIGRRRADQLAHLLGIEQNMILTDAEYHCVIGPPGGRTHDQEIIFACIYNLTNSNGNAAIPLSSYGLNITEQGNIRSICGEDSPCIEFNQLFGGPLEQIFEGCGCRDKLVRVETQTPFFQFIEDGTPCQESGGAACLIETTCAGNGR